MLRVDISKLLYITPTILLDTWYKRKYKNTTADIDDDVEEVAVRAVIDEWR